MTEVRSTHRPVSIGSTTQQQCHCHTLHIKYWNPTTTNTNTNRRVSGSGTRWNSLPVPPLLITRIDLGVIIAWVQFETISWLSVSVSVVRWTWETWRTRWDRPRIRPRRRWRTLSVWRRIFVVNRTLSAARRNSDAPSRLRHVTVYHMYNRALLLVLTLWRPLLPHGFSCKASCACARPS